MLLLRQKHVSTMYDNPDQLLSYLVGLMAALRVRQKIWIWEIHLPLMALAKTGMAVKRGRA